jgi:hypothetical protein
MILNKIKENFTKKGPGPGSEIGKNSSWIHGVKKHRISDPDSQRLYRYRYGKGKVYQIWSSPTGYPDTSLLDTIRLDIRYLTFELEGMPPTGSFYRYR